MLQEYDPQYTIEICLDEAGRGPLFGRLYVAAVVLPKDGSFFHKDVKDSKKIHSRTKMQTVEEYIRQNAVAWSVQYIEHTVIDEINIRQSVFLGMHQCIRDIFDQIPGVHENNTILLIDGNDFKPYMVYNPVTTSMEQVPHVTIEGGDNTYMGIAAASILAKSARDRYIDELCTQYPELKTRYSMDKNMGYGTKAHLEGILEHGITQWHRKTYGRCKEAKYNPLSEEKS
jgi:ribonuclease HII